MKKIFILPILIAPIMAHATDPVGPSAVGQGETPVVATASAPYATAGAETGDTTNVVSASYVKGAYNDAIAAVNKVNADKQGKLLNGSNNHNIESKVVSNLTGPVGEIIGGLLDTEHYNDLKSMIAVEADVQNLNDALISAGTVLDGFQNVGAELQYRQEKLIGGGSNDTNVFNDLFQADTSLGIGTMIAYNDIAADDQLKNYIPSVSGVASFIKGAIDTQRVSAVTTWGDDTHPTNLQLTTASN